MVLNDLGLMVPLYVYCILGTAEKLAVIYSTVQVSETVTLLWYLQTQSQNLTV